MSDNPSPPVSDASFELHRLTGRLDRSADRILQAELGVSYRRFLALLMVNELDGPTQRELADALGVSQPSVSRMTGVLAGEGLLAADRNPGEGNRRTLTLTAEGRELLAGCRELLRGRFAKLEAAAGVDTDRYAQDTRDLIAALDAAEDEASS